MANSRKRCCEALDEAVEGWRRRCEHHTTPEECPDALIAERRDGGYGLWVHDGGSSSITIHFCPFCGTRLAGRPKRQKAARGA